MAETFSEAGKVLRIGASLFGGLFAFTVATDNVEVAKEVCGTAKTLGQGLGQGLGAGLGIGLGLGAVYVAYNSLKPIIEGAVERGVGGERDDQDVRGIRPGSLHFELHCFTDERFLEVLADYESGRMKERLQEELSLVGIKVEGLKVKIENMEEVNEKKEAINLRSHINKDLGEMVKHMDVDGDASDEIKSNQRKTDDTDTCTTECHYDLEDHPEIAQRYFNIGYIQYHMKDYQSALESHMKALKIRLKVYGENDPATADSYYSIGAVEQDRGDYKSALEYYQRALEISLKLYGKDHCDTADTYYSIGITQHAMHDYQASIESNRKALNIRLRLHGEGHPSTADSYYCIGIAQHEMKDYKSALESHKKALEIRLKVYGDDDLATADSYYNIGYAQHDMKDYMSALSQTKSS
ncbi:kinesin light chain-like [Dendronephthya gigantea]|uniref:kinesin light chain-like n=1 Tax=Dendronephthya gigantea TaxID=151771 RepID=UPI00106BB523|nr:kinesin light chain-like [Dendronephthya gigantea]